MNRNDTYHITASCVIADNTVQKDGRVVFAENGSIPLDFFTGLYKWLQVDYPRFYKMDNLSKLGWLGSEILLKDSFEKGRYEAEEVGLVLSNANASLDTDIKYFQTVKEIASPSVFVYTLPNIMMGEICIRNRFKGETAFFIAADFDADLLEMYVNELLDHGRLQSCICGWVDVLNNNYKCILFLVEKNGTENSFAFTKNSMTGIACNRLA